MFGVSAYATFSYASTTARSAFQRGIGYILGRNTDTNTGIGARGRLQLGRNVDTNTGIGVHRKTLGVNKDTNTIPGVRLK